MAGLSLDELIGLEGLDARMLEIDERLDSMVRGDGSPFAAAATRVIGSGGKRLRPALTVASAAVGTADDDHVLNAAVAVELVQVGSLVHDDIFEGAATRRGVPTINAAEGDDFALMAGDYILARAGQAAAEAGQSVAKQLAITIEELCIGQLVETTELFDTDRTIGSQLDSIRRKTAALYSCACRVGALCADLAEHTQEALARFGEDFGIAFQLIDDVLDLVSDEARLGKPANIDIATGVYTMPVLLALQGPFGSELRRLLEARAPDRAREIVLRAGTIRQVVSQAHEYAARAGRSVEDSAHAAWLAGFPSRYVAWALEHFPTDPALVA